MHQLRVGRGAKWQAFKRGEMAQVRWACKRLQLEPAESVRTGWLAELEHHPQGMEDAASQAEGLPSGSGAAAGPCQYVVRARCQQAGRRCSEAGVAALWAWRWWVLKQQLDELGAQPQIAMAWAPAACAYQL